MRGARALSTALALASAACACAGTAATPAVTDRPDPGAPFAPLDYADAASWVCDPTRDDDPCTTADLTATEVLPDGSTREVPHARAEDPAIDCFYVHPTFAFAYEGGHETTTDGVERALAPVLHPAAPLTSHCRVFAPRYRQIRLTEYVVARDVEAGLERAYADVEAAFRHYLERHADGRPFVLLGHSQGTHTGRRLLERVIAPDEALRRRLVLAVLLGGDVLVDAETGETTNTGGVPLCRGDLQRGCVIAYRAYAKDHPPPDGSAPTVIGGVPEGQLPACNVPSRDGARIRFSVTYLATRARQNAYDPWPRNRPPYATPFVLYRDFYEGECVRDGAGYPYLAVSAPGAGAEARPGDVRVNRIPFDAIYYRADVLGAHLIEMGLVVGDVRAAIQAGPHTR